MNCCLKMSSVYILLENQRQFTNDDCKVMYVSDSFPSAMLRGWTLLVQYTMKPWSLDFYKNRNGEFKDMLGHPHYWIEQWNGGELVNKYYLGWNGKNVHSFDQLLKKSDKLEQTLQNFLDELLNGNIPETLQKLNVASQKNIMYK